MNSWNFSFANGILPLVSSPPSYADMTLSPIYGGGKYYVAGSSGIDYFYWFDTHYSVYQIGFSTLTESSTLYQGSDGNVTTRTLGTVGNAPGIYGYYTSVGSSSDTLSSDIPFLGSFYDKADAFNYVKNNGVSYPNLDVDTYSFTFQNGYLLVVDLGQSGTSYSYELSSKSLEYSNIGSEPFPDTNQSYWFDSSLPSLDETEIPSDSAITISWSKGSKTNIFGQTQDMVVTLSGVSSARYLYIYNPPVHYKWSGSNNPTASEVVNYPVTINGFTDSSIFYVYDSYARLTDFSQGGRVTATLTGEQGLGVVSDGAVTVTTSDGTLFEQNSGGSTDISGANGGSISENINGLKETLDNFVDSFISLLSAPISHIQQLISAGSDFFQVLVGLFSWLPSDISTLILSAFVVVVVIGVIKLLL